MPTSLLKESWEAGKVSRLTLIFGGLVSAAWAIIAAAATFRFIVDTYHEPALASPFKLTLLVVSAIVMLFLVIPLPATWLMYALLRLDERRRRASGPKP